jgi:hypothetical protein
MRTHTMFAALVILIVLTGCAHLGPTAEQMKAMEGLSSSLCIKSPGWNGSAVEVHYSSFGGKATGTAGGGGKAACGTSTVEFANEGRVVKP